MKKINEIILTNLSEKSNALLVNKTGDVTSDTTDKDYIHFLKEELKYKNEIISYLLPRSTNKEDKINTGRYFLSMKTLQDCEKNGDFANFFLERMVGLGKILA